MKTSRNLAYIALAALLSACGSNFEWFPSYTDTTGPTVTATIAPDGAPTASVTIFNNRTTHLPFPATVKFSADEAATIYYTTNGLDPTTGSPSVAVIANTNTTGPQITLTNTILKFFGVDTLSNASAIQKNTVVSP